VPHRTFFWFILPSALAMLLFIALPIEEVKAIWNETPDFGSFLSGLMNLPFYKALAFTLTYLFVVTPLVIVPGFAIALAVNTLHPIIKGPVIQAYKYCLIIPSCH